MTSKIPSALLNGFIDAMLWASVDDDDNALDKNYSSRDVAPESLAAIEAMCAKFLDAVDAIEATEGDVEHNTPSGNIRGEQGGHDLFLTCAGHGVGFWDGDWTQGDALTDACHALARDLCVTVGHDGQVYCEGFKA